MIDNQLNKLIIYAMTGSLTLVVVVLHFRQILVFWCRAFSFFLENLKKL